MICYEAEKTGTVIIKASEEVNGILPELVEPHR